MNLKTATLLALIGVLVCILAQLAFLPLQTGMLELDYDIFRIFNVATTIMVILGRGCILVFFFVLYNNQK